MDNELFELNDDLGLELKKSFKKEFDINEIYISEDLIARTMAAIKTVGLSSGSEAGTNNALSEENASKAVKISEESDLKKEKVSEESELKKEAVREESELKNKAVSEESDLKRKAVSEETGLKKAVSETPDHHRETEGSMADNITDISSRSNRKKAIKWISGIAAALLLGVIVLFVVKIGVGGYKKSEDKATVAANSIINFSAASDSKDEVKEEKKDAYTAEEPQMESITSEASSDGRSGKTEHSKASDDSSLCFDESIGFDSKYSMGKEAGQYNLSNNTVKNDASYDGFQSTGAMESDDSEEDRDKADTKRDETSADDNAKTQDISNEGAPREDELYISEEELKGQISGMTEELIRMTEESEGQGLTREEIVDFIRSTDIYEVLMSDKETSIELLQSIYTKNEDSTEKMLLEILIEECENKDKS